jgi:hypothetical protein
MSVRDSLLSPLAAIASADLETPALTSVAAALRRLDSRFVARGAEPFDAMEAAMVGALAQTLCATDGDDLPPPDDKAAVRFIERYVLGLPPTQMRKLRDLLVLWEFQPLVYGPDRARFSRLRPEQRHANIESWAQSANPRRTAIFRSLKTLCMLWYWTQPATWGAIGYDGPRVEPGYQGGNENWAGADLHKPEGP